MRSTRSIDVQDVGHLAFSLSVKVVTQYQRGVLFRLGKVVGVKELVIPPNYRSGHCTGVDDDRGGAEERFNGRRPARDRRRRPRTAHRLLSPDISPAHPEVSTMTVTVTLPGGGTDQYMRFGDAYVRHNDGTLDVIRGGAKRPYTSGEWTDVEGDQKKFNRRGFWR